VYLKNLTLKGFKSFAQTTSLDMEPGVTVVVGPNGSGKSNVVDAITWVLGAQGARALRGSKMDDVIFAGTTKLEALGRAQVELTIDNSSGRIPVEASEITIGRTLFRSGESEYTINGTPCRLLDVQELLSDSGVGRQQHVIVSQGNLATILNAQPEDRRAVIEEAAGILKFRKRKEKAQRRLEGTEVNLTRVQDLVREVRRQMRPLERQASAARRHAELSAQLGILRLYVAGQDWLKHNALLAAASEIVQAFDQREHQLLAELNQAEQHVRSIEDEYSTLGSDGVGESLTQAEGLRQRARGLAAVITERLRSVERARNASIDADVVASLEAESARIKAELMASEVDAATLVPELEQLSATELELADEKVRIDVLREQAEVASANAAHVAGLNGELGPLRASLNRVDQDVDRLEHRIASIANRREELRVSRDELVAQLELATSAESALVAKADQSTAARAAAAYVVAEAEEEWRQASDARVAMQARADALQAALDQTRSQARADQLGDAAGVVGTLAELIAIDLGYEAAFEAAAGSVLSGIVVDGVASGRAAIATLRSAGSSGRVLAVWKEATSAINALTPPSLATALQGDSVSLLRAHVSATDESADSLLDQLLSRVVVVDNGTESAIDLALRHPELIVVTPQGDRLAGSVWRFGVHSAGVTAKSVEEALLRAEEAIEIEARVAQRLATLRERQQEAVVAEDAAVEALSQNDNVLTKAADALARTDGELTALDVDEAAQRAELVASIARRSADQTRVGELESELAILAVVDDPTIDHRVVYRQAQAAFDERLRALGVLRRDLEVRAASLEQRRTLLTQRSAEVEARLERLQAERAMAEQTRGRLDQTFVTLTELAETINVVSMTIEGEHSRLTALRQAHQSRVADLNQRLESARQQRDQIASRLEGERERVRRAQIDAAEAGVHLENITEHITVTLESTIEDASAAELPELPEGVQPAVRLDELERELRILGPVNPLALDELAELEERHEFLQTQLTDVQNSRRELETLITEIDQEIVRVFTEAYADVATNFAQLFSALFPGGTGALVLTDPDNMLDTGVEVEAKPGGKNVRKLSLLSGGERSLTAMAFLFAVFRSRPSPFYVLDEVEAALDDVNVKRFIGLVEEFRKEAQLIIVTHQKRTMEAADSLYGVSMQPGGSSRVVSEKVANKPELRGETIDIRQTEEAADEAAAPEATAETVDQDLVAP
jgi:chromosome segregation protein